MRDLLKLEADLEIVAARVEAVVDHVNVLHTEVVDLLDLINDARVRAAEVGS
jgi:hypothetical protein